VRDSTDCCHWRKSTKSLSSDCVEVALGCSEVRVRDSKDRDGPTLAFAARSWEAFISDIKDGRMRR
jgi:hypothetical protein